MNDLVRRLLSGASIVTLQLCAIGAARASAGLQINGATGPVIVTAAKTPQFIEVTSTGAITGSLTNEGTVGLNDVGIGVADGAKITGSIVNAKTGVINASEAGIYVSATAVVGGGITNAGKIQVQNIQASDSAKGVVGIRDIASGNGNLTNSGSLMVTASAANQGSRDVGATAKGMGIDHDGNISAAVTDTLSNTGSIAINAKAVNAAITTTGNVIEVHADAGGALFQTAKNSGFAISQTLTNTGTINISAVASGTIPVGTSAKAEVGAEVVSIMGQEASVTAAVPITQVMSNGATITATASAAVVVKGKAEATAKAGFEEAFFQEAEGGTNIAQTITNTGSITLNAVAKINGAASSSAKHGAEVVADGIFVQEAGGYSQSVAQTFSNTAAIKGTFTATATNGEFNHAIVEVGGFVGQTAKDPSTSANSKSTTVTQSITNSGTLTLSATANASVASTAKAGAEFNDVFEQDATGTTVSQTITNSGAVALNATAKAVNGSSAKAGADAGFDDLFVQDATGTTVSQTITNSGAISLTALAQATAGKSGSAKASADAHSLFAQEAEASHTVDATSATLNISNSASLNVSLTADAKNGERPHADAEFDGVFVQSAENFDTVAETITNTAAITITAGAKATGTVAPNAFASAGRLFVQSASTDNASDVGKTANLTINNSGAISVALTANAKNAGTGAAPFINTYAGAGVDFGTLAHQSATEVRSVTEKLTNSGNISLVGTANYSGAAVHVRTYSNSASADAAHLFKQSAEDSQNITQSVSNSGTVTLNLTAKAKLTGSARATARDNGVVSQYADGDTGNDASVQTITNSNTGSLSLTLSANAQGVSRVRADAGQGDPIFAQNAEDEQSVTQSITNDASIQLKSTAYAKNTATGTALGFASADANVGSLVGQGANPDSDNAVVSQIVSNTGAINETALATALGGSSANAGAGADFGRQNVNGGTSATESLTNSGVVTTTMTAKASGVFADADVNIDGWFDQSANGVQTASLAVVNAGNISIVGHATATGAGMVAATGTDESQMAAYVRFRGIGQSAEGGSGSGNDRTAIVGQAAKLSITNSGHLSLSANANVKGFSAYAEASAIGVSQSVSEEQGSESFDNSGTFSVTAVANAQNTGKSLPLDMSALENGHETLADADAFAVGLNIKASGQAIVHLSNSGSEISSAPSNLSVNITNSGTFSVAATAIGNSFSVPVPATAPATVPITSVPVAPSAVARGINLSATSRVASTNRSHTVDSVTVATSHGGTKTTDVHHYTSGERYTGGTLNGSIDNSGSLIVSATAVGGNAEAEGVRIVASTQDVAVTNEASGLIDVTAVGATAVAHGIQELNSSYKSQDVGTYVEHNPNYNEHGVYTSSTITGPSTVVKGAITNDGTIEVSATGTVSAKADGISLNAMDVQADVLNAGTINVSATGPGAVANGIAVFAAQTGLIHKSAYHNFYSSVPDTNIDVPGTTKPETTHSVVAGNKLTGSVTNSGTIDVTANGANALAAGINVTADVATGSIDNSGMINASATGTGAVADGIVVAGAGAFVINNDGGTIEARVNTPAEAFGNAIDVSAAPNASILLNGGTIDGNIVENAAGNAISVNSGNTLLEGVINPSQAKVGSLTISAGGTLTLAANTGLGSAKAYVGTFNQAGTLGFVATPDAGQTGSIHAGAATISGGVQVDIATSQSPYALGATTYRLVFSDAALSGTWSDVSVANDSTFFSASGQYSANEADVVLTRTAFSAVSGLTPNEASVGGALETIYDNSGTGGPLGNLLNALLNLSGPQYQAALDALSGEPVGELVNANSQSAQSFLDQIETHLGGDFSSGPQGTASLAAPSSAVQASVLAPSGANGVAPAQLSDVTVSNVWGGAVMGGGHTDPTISGPGYRTTESGLIAGVDLPIAPDFIVGVVGSYGSGDLETDHLSADGRYTAGQIAGYARYTGDQGLYASALVAYGDFQDKLNRFISIPGLGSGTTAGKFSTDVWSLYGEAGWHYDVTDFAMVTPYAAISYQDAHADGYTETGFLPLKIGSSSSKATSSYLGVNLSRTWDDGNTTFTPHLKAAWQHDFTRDAWVMQASFAAVPTVGFGLNGSGLSRDSAYLNAGVTLGIASNVDLLLDYDGRFSSDQSESSFMARANIKF